LDLEERSKLRTASSLCADEENPEVASRLVFCKQNRFYDAGNKSLSLE